MFGFMIQWLLLLIMLDLMYKLLKKELKTNHRILNLYNLDKAWLERTQFNNKTYQIVVYAPL